MSAEPNPSNQGDDGKKASIASGGGPPYDGNMESRVEKLEADYAAIKLSLEILMATCATKSDLAEHKTDIAELKATTKADIAELKASTEASIAELRASTKAEIAEAKASLIMWTVSAIFLSQLLPSILKLFL
jgi:hypothetical protein